MADYDSGEITERERLAAQHQKDLANYNADTIKNQLSQQLYNYDIANKQNRSLADVQLKQNSRKNEADRFQAQRDLRNSAIGLMGTMGNAMNGSSTLNLIRMLDDRQDNDNVNYWNQLQTNQNTVENAYDEAVNQNVINQNDAVANAEAQMRGIEADTAANMNNINPNLYEAPGTGEMDLGSNNYFERYKYGGTEKGGDNYNNARLSGYIMPNNSRQQARQVAPANTVRRNDYFGRLLNGFNRR